MQSAFTVIGFESAPGSEIDTPEMSRPVYDVADLDTFTLLRSGLWRAIRTLGGIMAILGFAHLIFARYRPVLAEPA